MKSRKSLLFASLLLGFFLTACGGGGDDGNNWKDEPGNISGFGDAPGPIQGRAFRLPSGIEVIGNIQLTAPVLPRAPEDARSSVSEGTKFGGKAALRSALERKGTESGASNRSLDGKYTYMFYESSVGSGTLTLSAYFQNKNSTATRIVFPARTVFVPIDAPRAQRLILLKEVSVTIPPSDEYTVSFDVQCGNLYLMEDMDIGMPYELSVVSNSITLADLTDRLVNKKINIEEYEEAEVQTYLERSQKLQGFVHNLTDYGVPLSEEDKQWIEALPKSGG